MTVMEPLWSAVLTTVFFAVGVSTLTPLHLSIYLPLKSGLYFDIAPSVLVAIEIATEIINNRTDILPNYELKLHVSDTKADPSEAVKQLFLQLYTPPTKIMILGPIFSKESITLAEAANAWNLLQFVFVPRTPELSDRKRFPHFYRTLPDEMSSNQLRLAFLHRFGWKRIAIVYEDEMSNTFAAAMEKFRQGADLLNISTVVFKGIKSLDSVTPALDLIQGYKRNLYGKKFVWILVGWTHAARPWWLEFIPGQGCTTEQLTTFQQGHFTTNYLGLRSTADQSDSNVLELSSAAFITEHRKRIAYDPSASSYIGFAFDALVSAALTLNRSIEILRQEDRALEDFSYSSSKMADVFNGILENLVFTGMTGPVSYSNGARVGILTLKQSQGNHIPVDGTQKLKQKVTLSRGVVISMISMASIGILTSLYFLYFNTKNRKLQYIKLSSPNLNNLVAIGGILSYCYIILAGIAGTVAHSQNMAILCTAKVWILCFAFSISFGAIFSKTWRVHKVMSAKTTKKKNLRDGHLFIIIVMVLAVDVGILLPWAVVDPWKVVTTFISEQADPYNDDIVYKRYMNKCQCSFKVYWTSALYIYKGVFVLFGVFLAWDTRYIRIAALNDSKFIGLSIYNVTVLSVIGAPIGYVIDDEDFGNAYIINSLFIIFSASITLGLVFVPKMIALHLNPGGEANISTVPVAPANNGGASTSQAFGSETSNNRLRLLVKEQEETIARLQKEVQRCAVISEST